MILTMPSSLLAQALSSTLTSKGTDWVAISAVATLVAAAVPFVMFAINVFLFRRPGQGWNRRSLPTVSVLIPARNEELSIEAAILAVSRSRGVNWELVVLDDGSTDRTGEIVRAIAEIDPRVRLEKAPPLPDGWNGKQHACWVLAAKATQDVFCFLDADVRLGPEALYRMLSEINVAEEGEPEKALVSGFPRQETRTFLERLLLPLIHFVLLGFLPLAGERWTRRSGFAAGCGQMLMVKRQAYFASGGHSGISTTMHDGLLLPQVFRRLGFRTSVYDLSQDAVCRMYRNGGEVWRGLSKNATEGMASPGRIPIFTVMLLLGQVLPFPVWVWASLAQNDTAAAIAFWALLLGYGIRFVSAIRYRQSWLGVLLHPLGVLVLLSLQWSALFGKMIGRPATWKQRVYRAG
jgi:hypothetical protein